uniref:Uncharacterized protein n=1 Tax=Caenorhabditis japonica TaxID=281687 RepID=A0A8R1IUB9_CAEJA
MTLHERTPNLPLMTYTRCAHSYPVSVSKTWLRPESFQKLISRASFENTKSPALLVANPVRYLDHPAFEKHPLLSVDFAQFGELPTFRKQACRSTNNP